MRRPFILYDNKIDKKVLLTDNGLCKIYKENVSAVVYSKLSVNFKFKVIHMMKNAGMRFADLYTDLYTLSTENFAENGNILW